MAKPGGGQPNMQQLMRQAQRMQQEMTAARKQLAGPELTGSAGGGRVTATVSVAGELLGAIRDGQRQPSELGESAAGPVTGRLGGLGPPGF